jgi:hypothetical protein
MTAGTALRKFRRHTTGSGRLELGRQVSSRPHPDSSMGRAAYATLGCVYGYYRKPIVVLSSIVSRQCVMTTERALSAAPFAPECARFND